MKDSEKITLMLACGALHDIAEKGEKSASQIKEVEVMIEKIIPPSTIPPIPFDEEEE